MFDISLDSRLSYRCRVATPPKTPLDSESVLSYNKSIALQCIIHEESVFRRCTNVNTFGNSLELASLNDVSLNFNDVCRSRINGRQMQNVVPFSHARKLLGKKSVADKPEVPRAFGGTEGW